MPSRFVPCAGIASACTAFSLAFSQSALRALEVLPSAQSCLATSLKERRDVAAKVPNPMFLNDIREKMRLTGYSSLGDFVGDVYRSFETQIAFHGKGSKGPAADATATRHYFDDKLLPSLCEVGYVPQKLARK